MKKGLVIILLLGLIVSIIGCSSNNVSDKRIIGTWESSMGARYVFKENGTVSVLTEENVRDYEAENGSLKISYGKFGDDYYTYEIVYGVTEDNESVVYLVLNDTYFQKVSD